MGKDSQVSASTKWRLGENVVLQLMECLTASVSFETILDISHLFICLPTLELTTFEQHVRSTKIGYAMHYYWGETSKQKSKKAVQL